MSVDDKQIMHSKNRLNYWDNMKGTLILLVVFGHFLWGYWGLGFADSLIKTIYLFHMPAFVFVAGYLSKSKRSKSSGSIIRLFLIYIIFNTIILFLHNILYSSMYSLITPSYSYWFLLSLMIWRLSAPYLAKIKNATSFLIIAAILVGFWPDVTNVLAISRTIVFSPFFMMGYTYDTKKITDQINNTKISKYIQGIILVSIGLVLAIFISQTQLITQNNIVMSPYKSIMDLVVRLMVFQISLLIIIGLKLLINNGKIPLITKSGKNSLAIYVLHRPITLLYLLVFTRESYNEIYIFYAIIATLVTVYVLGLDSVSKFINNLFDGIINKLKSTTDNISRRSIPLKTTILSILLVLLLATPALTSILGLYSSSEDDSNTYQMHKAISDERLAAFDNSTTISFVGDMILLQGQVESAWDETSETYNFDSVFEYAKKYLKESDLAIGVLEGPLAGEEAGYSTSNYDDGIPLALNFPDSFAVAIKDSGIDLVTLANNHLLDKNIEGAVRTRQILDEIGLEYTGSYENRKDKEKPHIVEVNGMRFGILSYTFKSNGYTDEYFIKESPDLTSILVEPNSEYFREVKENVENDFKRLKEMESPPDLIIAIPHIGTQFIHETDCFQKTWNQVFTNSGADIILGDHSHAVQPIEYVKGNLDDNSDHRTIIVNSPGNFVNSYIKHNGDATAIVEIYIDEKTKEIIGSSIIPMYTQSPTNGYYRALPIFDIVTDESLKSEISVYEMERIKEVHKIVTSVMLGAELTIDQVQERYYYLEDGYVKHQVKPILLDNLSQNEFILNAIEEANTISFVGDSITKGSRNGGYGWYEPITSNFIDKNIINLSWDSATTKTLLDKSDSIKNTNADLFVIAIGTNDVRYRNSKTCAMDSKTYIENIELLIQKITRNNSEAKIILVAPWLALDNDPFTVLPNEERDYLLSEYGEALKGYSKENGYLYSNPNTNISNVLRRKAEKEFLVDHIHPNASKGIRLYSESFISSP